MTTPSRVLEELFSGAGPVEEKVRIEFGGLEQAMEWAKNRITFLKNELGGSWYFFNTEPRPWDTVTEEMWEEFLEYERWEWKAEIHDLQQLLRRAKTEEDARRELCRAHFCFGPGDYIRQALREVSFARKVIPPERIGPPGKDSLIKILDTEPKSKAMAISFQGEPTTEPTKPRKHGP